MLFLEFRTIEYRNKSKVESTFEHKALKKDCVKVWRLYRVLIGSVDYISQWLQNHYDKTISNISEISELLDPNAIVAKEILSRQCLWLLTLICLQFKGNYFVRHIPPQFTQSFCSRMDNEIKSLITKCFLINFEKLPTFTERRIHLPIKLGGIGVRQLERLRWTEFLGGVMEGVIPPPSLPP